MTLRIEKYMNGEQVVLKLVGQIQGDDLEELKAQMETNGTGMAFDLDELTLLDAVVVRFFVACEDAGLGLINCAPYIREWMKRERVRGEKALGGR